MLAILMLVTIAPLGKQLPEDVGFPGMWNIVFERTIYE